MLIPGSLPRKVAIALWLFAGAVVLPAQGAAQSPGPLTPADILADGQAEGLSSPTYAASPQGSPYSEIYSRTFGASGAAAPGAGTATPGPTPSPGVEDAGGEVVYVIDSNGLLTYRAEDFSRGAGTPIGHNPQPLPAATASSGTLQVPTVAKGLYLQPPLETAAGPAPAPSPAPGASPGLAP